MLVVDANGTRFHLLLGEADWQRTSRQDLEWDKARQEIRLWSRVFRFAAGSQPTPLDLGQRRGAGRDAFGTWYWIAPDERSILVRSSGSDTVSVFWPVPDSCTAASDGAGFRPAAVAAATPPTLRGLAVTDDHYLVVGQVGPAGQGGVLVFDLYAGGPPRLRVWPTDFAPFDLAPRHGGGVWVLERANQRVWELGSQFEFVIRRAAAPLEGGEPHFANADGSASRPCATPRADVDAAWPVAARDPIGIAPVDEHSVLVLESDDGSSFGRIHVLTGGVATQPPLSLNAMLEHVDQNAREEKFTLVAHDFALGARAAEDGKTWVGRLYVVAREGQQVYAFDVERTPAGTVALDAQPDYYPMRLFGGRGVVTANGEPFYDAAERWLALQQQKRPRYVETGELTTQPLDSGQPGCVWHRLMLDGWVPSDTAIQVWTRAADADLELAQWQQEPLPRLRGDGSELPYVAGESGRGRGTYELLFQRAVGRLVQIKLVLHGDGRATPRVRAMRAWYPRFSYLNAYLPAVYRDDAESASFLDRFLANIEGMFTTIEDRMAAAQILFDASSAPPETLEWLGQWFGVALDPAWDEQRRRLFLRHATDFFAMRGTIRGLQVALRLALDECVDERLFDAPTARTRQAASVRIVEHFRTRRTSRALVGDVTTATPGPQLVSATERWRPELGGEDLHRRYRQANALGGDATFPLAGGTDQWRAFAEMTLGFVPSIGAAERREWRVFVRRRHNESQSAMNGAHGTAGVTFATLRVVTDEPPTPGLVRDWRWYLAARPNVTRERWHAFLARRYRNIDALNAAWRTAWTAFSHVPLPDVLPGDGPALTDWFQFEGSVLAMHRTAHRFSVMIPIRPSSARATQQRRVALAEKVLALEKPAHTQFDTRFYWAMFRLGEARLGDDTLLDRGGRSPDLMRPMVLGEGYLAEGFLAPAPGADAPDRLQIGRDRIGRSTRIGGP